MMEPDTDEGDESGPGSPVDRLEAMADRLSEGAAALKKIADTAKPLYASLDDSQKRLFGMLGHEMMMLGHGRGMMGWRELGGAMGGPEHGGMMGWDHGHPGWGPPPHHGDEEGSDDEQ